MERIKDIKFFDYSESCKYEEFTELHYEKNPLTLHRSGRNRVNLRLKPLQIATGKIEY